MNLILLDSDEAEVVLPGSDPRARHVIEVLRRWEGGAVDVGLADGRMGKAVVGEVGRDELRLSVEWLRVSPELFPITMIIGMARPQTARRLLREMTAMGVHRLFFCETDRSDPGYARSRLWTSGEYVRHLKAGAEQAFNPRLPEIKRFSELRSAIGSIDQRSDRIALDNYEAPESLTSWMPSTESCTLALGAERGWSAGERDLLREGEFVFCHLGSRVLRLETAATAAAAIVLSQMGLV